MNKVTKIFSYGILFTISLFLPFILPIDEAVAEVIPYAYGFIFGTLAGSFWLKDRSNREQYHTLFAKRNVQLNAISSKYNKKTLSLENSFKYESNGMNHSAEQRLRQTYSTKYDENKKEYLQERKAFEQQWNTQHPQIKKMRKEWNNLIAVGLVSMLFACNYTVSSVDQQATANKSSSLMSDTATQTWTVATLPQPDFSHGERYWVANPDHVVSESTVSELRSMLAQLNDSLDIETAVIIVNHIEGAIESFAMDVFDQYKVGRNDRGLVMVLAYQDHLFRTQTGRSLEGDLTDAECGQMQREYIIPSMKAERPDSGMIYYTQAIYNLLQGKGKPVLSALTSPTQETDDHVAGIFMLYSLVLAAWIALIFYVRKRYNPLSGVTSFYKNPFIIATAAAVGGAGFNSFRDRDSGGGFGGGGFGGGFSGGSSGGGGATSSW